jgi:hypothetical protein
MSLRANQKKYKTMPRDCYFTPAHAVQSLLTYHNELVVFRPFSDEIWECAGGAGHIAKIFKAYGFRVFASDIKPAPKPVFPVTAHDFLKSSGLRGGPYSIVTNPPYGAQSALILDFMAKGFELMDGGHCRTMALLLPFEFDAVFPRNDLVGEHPYFVAKVSCKKRCRWVNLPQKDNGPMGVHAWFIWSTDLDLQRRAKRAGNMVVR